MKYSLKEYILYISLRLASNVFIILPVKTVIFLGRTLGTLVFHIDRKHRDIAYKNLRLTLSHEKSIPQLKKILKSNFQNFGMNLAETLMIPKVDKKYVQRYIEIEGEENLKAALKKQRGALLLSIHMGSWEVGFVAVGILGLKLYILVEEQRKNLLLDKFLNQLRQSKGIRILRVGSQMREIHRILRENKIVVLVADHGIKEGIPVEFFGRKASTPTGAIKLALKLDIPILPAYIRRIRGGRHRIAILPTFDLKRTEDLETDITYNLTAINKIFEDCIRRYPCQYHWTYKRFKYIRDREILVLTDGKVGHLRQLEACIKLIREIGTERNLEIKIRQIKVEFKNKLYKFLQTLSVGLVKKFSCRGCLWCMRTFLKRESFLELQSCFADMVISCGSSLAGVNFVLSSENQARSVVIMRPGILSTKRFDLLIIPRHDRPPKRENVVMTAGALNLIDEEYLNSCKNQVEKYLPQKVCQQLMMEDRKPVLGLLIGGDTRVFHLNKDLMKQMLSQIKSFLERQDAVVLVTTSRRTPHEIEGLIKEEFRNYSRCKLLLIANERNIPGAVGAILGFSHLVVVSPESISMISEAASSGRYVVVFDQRQGLGLRHNRFLDHLYQNGYIYLEQVKKISETLENIAAQRPPVHILTDRAKVRRALEGIL